MSDLNEQYERLFADVFAPQDRTVGDRTDDLVLSPSEARLGCVKRVRIERIVRCTRCDALASRCGECHGGYRSGTEEIDLIVKPDTPHAARISVLGKGDAGPGRPSGNRYFVVTIDGHLPVQHPYRAGHSPSRPAQRGTRREPLPWVAFGMFFVVMVLLIGFVLLAR